jgi:hypothetical protein
MYFAAYTLIYQRRIDLETASLIRRAGKAEFGQYGSARDEPLNLFPNEYPFVYIDHALWTE